MSHWYWTAALRPRRNSACARCPRLRAHCLRVAEERKREIQAHTAELDSIIAQLAPQLRRLERDAARMLAELDKRVMLGLLTPLLDDLKHDYAAVPEAGVIAGIGGLIATRRRGSVGRAHLRADEHIERRLSHSEVSYVVVLRVQCPDHPILD